MSDLKPIPSSASVSKLRPTRTPPVDRAYYTAGDVQEENPILSGWAFVRRNIWLILALGVVGLAIAAYFLSRAVPIYQAQAVVRIIDRSSAMVPGTGMPVARLASGTDEILTQVQVLKSRAILGTVVDQSGLRVTADPEEIAPGTLQEVSTDSLTPAGVWALEFTADRVRLRGGQGTTAEGPYGQIVEADGVRLAVAARPPVDSARLNVSPRSHAINALDRDLRVWRRERTNVIDIQYLTPDPVLAARVVNTASLAFQEVNKEAAQLEARRRRAFLEEQVSGTATLFLEAQQALSNFRSREGVYSSQAQLAQEQSALNGLDVRRAELAADRNMYRSLLAELETRTGGDGEAGAIRTLLSTPGISENPSVAGLAERLADMEMRRDSLTSGPYGKIETNPEVRRLDSVIASLRGDLTDALRSQLSAVDARVSALDQLRVQSSEQLRAQPPVEAEEVRLVQRVETIGNIAEQLSEDLERARMSEAIEAGQVEILDVAPVPEDPTNGGRGRTLALGLLLGLVAGCGASYLRENMDTAIRRREDVESAVHRPILAVVPQFVAGAHTTQRFRLPRLPRLSRSSRNTAITVGHLATPDLIALTDARSPAAESFRTLRTNLLFSESVDSLRTLVVTSSAPSEGKTTTAANVAVSLAQQGVSVVLVDCDLRRPRAHEVFHVPRDPGLTNAVAGRQMLDQVIRVTTVENLSFIPAGVLPPNPAELLGGARFLDVMQQLNARFDVVILDTPPLLAAADAAILGRESDGVILVVRAGQTDRGAVKQAVGQLASVGAHLVGVVLNDPDGAVERSGGHYHYDYYGADA